MNTLTKRMYEVVLKSPGLTDMVKLDMRMSKMNLLFLARVIDYALEADIKKDEELLGLMPAETKAELANTKAELLKRAELGDFYGDLVKMG